ncbi:ribonuclease H-like domain-containing protein [Aspergillus varians]
MVYRMEIYADGGCRGNGSPHAIGAAAAALKSKHGRYTGWTKGLPSSTYPTNQRAEITAIILALEVALEKYNSLDTTPHLDVTIYSDSRYAISYMTKWIYKWCRNGCVNAKGREVCESRSVSEGVGFG